MTAAIQNAERINFARRRVEEVLADPTDDRLLGLIDEAAAAMRETNEQTAADWNEAVLLLAGRLAPRLDTSIGSEEPLYEALAIAAHAAKDRHDRTRGVSSSRLMMVGVAGAIALSKVDWSTADTPARTRLLDFVDQNLRHEPGDIPLMFSMASLNDNQVGTFGSSRLLSMVLDDGGRYLDNLQSADSEFRVLDLILNAAASLATHLNDNDLTRIAAVRPSLLGIARARALVEADTLRAAAEAGLAGSDRLI